MSVELISIYSQLVDTTVESVQIHVDYNQQLYYLHPGLILIEAC